MGKDQGDSQVTPPRSSRTLNQDTPADGVCAGHAAFERMIGNMMENLGDQMEQMIEVVKEQSKANADALARLLEAQSARRELCGQQNARLDAIEKSRVSERSEMIEAHKEIWSAINKLRFYVFIGVGVVVALNALLVLVVKHMG